MSQRTPAVAAATLAEAEAEAAALTNPSDEATTPATATATTTPAVNTAGFDTDWAAMDYLNEGVFGSIDGRTRSTSGSTVYRHTRLNSSSISSFPNSQSDTGLRLEHCTESSEPDKVDECLTELSQFLDREDWQSEHALQILSQQVPRLLAHFKWYIRARTYRLLRRHLSSPHVLEYCRAYMEMCLVNTLTRDDVAHIEREQGLKYIRWTMRFDEECWLLGPPVVKVLMAVAEQADDRMRNICLETLCEVLVLAPERLWYVNGIRTMVLAALDGPWSTSIAISAALAHMFDRPETRRYAHCGMALGGVISTLTESSAMDGREQDQHVLAERAKVAAFMLTQFLKSWSGIQYFLSDQRRMIRALMQSLALVDVNCKVILGMLLELFGLSDEFDAVQLQHQQRFDVELLSPFHLPAHTITYGAARSRLLPVDYLRTLLLMVFIDEGLVEALVSVSLESELPDVVDASATLLKWLSQHPHIPLPESYVMRFQTLEALVNNALGQQAKTSIGARRVISKIEHIPSLSMGQLPSQKMDAWASSLASGAVYRHHLKQRRLRRNLGLQDSVVRTRRGNTIPLAHHQVTRLDHPDNFMQELPSIPGMVGLGGGGSKGLQSGASSSMMGGSKGLAAGLKDNAVRALRSSASTGNLKAAAAAGSGAGSGTPVLGTVNEGLLSATPAFRSNLGSDSSTKGRRSLDIVRNPQLPLPPPPPPKHLAPLLLRGLTSSPSTKSNTQQLPSLNSSSYVQVENGPLGTATANSMSSQASLPPDSSGRSAPLTSNSSDTFMSAMPVPVTTPSLHSRARTKSRSRISRTSTAIVEDKSPLTQLIQESLVLTEENPMQWNWRAIRAIILGPTSLSRKLQSEEAVVSGFLSRLARFFHPSSLEFCDLSRTTSNEEYLEIGRHLIRILISSADGLLLIDESRLLPGIVDEIQKQNSYARKAIREESCFSFARLQMTMSPGYFHFLSEIDRSVGGDSLLERTRLFDAYYQVVELPDQVLLIQYILGSMSYSSEGGHARNILRKVASSPFETLRLLVPSFLLYLASDSPCRPGSISAWVIEVLLTMSYDASPPVRSAAAQCLVLVIDLAAENPYLGRNESDARMAHLLELQPMFDLAVITDIRPLVMRVIATEAGFAYLKEQGVVDGEMEAWGSLEGIFFVQSVELDISRALAHGPLFSSMTDGTMVVTTSLLTPSTPPHLFGELTRSAGGRQFLGDSGIPRLLFETLDNIPWDSALPADVTGLKATLWAIGAMGGASRDGYLLLEPYNVVDKITEVARQTPSLSLKGTCMYALALISRTSFAAEVFRERGWLLCSSCDGAYEFAVPKRLEHMLDGSGWAEDGRLLQDTYVFSEDKSQGSLEDLDSVQREIVESVILMSNHVMVNTASKTLMRLRTSHPHYFRLLPLYCRAMHLLGKYRYRLSTRRFIFEVFDVNLATLHEEQLRFAIATAEDSDVTKSSGSLSADVANRRFSSGSQFWNQGSDVQRKRASTLQGLSSSVFARRQTNGLIDDNMRPSRNTVSSQTTPSTGPKVPPVPTTNA
ncbi:hypothetical protein GGF46_001045 [Coemansia sp. RSA 552]|nr:hypothetical protein GGF46_001045 [Coemansia sp. RSA 552]